MVRKLIGLIIVIALAFNSALNVQEAKAASASVPLSVTVNGVLVLSDAGNDTAAGKDPTLNVNLTVTPDLGHTTQSGSANMRLRTNKSAWRLTASRTSSSAGTTQIADTDVKVDISTSAGTKANASAGAITTAFTGQKDLTAIPTTGTADVITGTAKTSSARDFANADNWFQVGTTYSIDPDFFYEPGTFSTTITYNLVSP